MNPAVNDVTRHHLACCGAITEAAFFKWVNFDVPGVVKMAAKRGFPRSSNKAMTSFPQFS